MVRTRQGPDRDKILQNREKTGTNKGGGGEVREVDKIRLLHALKILVVGGWLRRGGVKEVGWGGVKGGWGEIREW